MIKESSLANAVSVHRLKETHGTIPGTIQCTSTPGGGGGGSDLVSIMPVCVCIQK